MNVMNSTGTFPSRAQAEHSFIKNILNQKEIIINYLFSQKLERIIFFDLYFSTRFVSFVLPAAEIQAIGD